MCRRPGSDRANDNIARFAGEGASGESPRASSGVDDYRLAHLERGEPLHEVFGCHAAEGLEEGLGLEIDSLREEGAAERGNRRRVARLSEPSLHQRHPGWEEGEGLGIGNLVDGSCQLARFLRGECDEGVLRAGSVENAQFGLSGQGHPGSQRPDGAALAEPGDDRGTGLAEDIGLGLAGLSDGARLFGWLLGSRRVPKSVGSEHAGFCQRDGAGDNHHQAATIELSCVKVLQIRRCGLFDGERTPKGIETALGIGLLPSGGGKMLLGRHESKFLLDDLRLLGDLLSGEVHGIHDLAEGAGGEGDVLRRAVDLELHRIAIGLGGQDHASHFEASVEVAITALGGEMLEEVSPAVSFRRFRALPASRPQLNAAPVGKGHALDE